MMKTMTIRSTQPHSSWLTDLSLLAVAVIWGSSYAACKEVLEQMSVLQFLFVRFALATVLLLPFAWTQLRQLDRQTVRSGLLFGCLIFAIFLAEMFGVRNTSASNTGFLIAVYVVMVPLIESVLARTKLPPAVLGAALLSLTGTALLTIKAGWQLDFNLGDALVLLAASIRAVQMVVSKRIASAIQTDRSLALTTLQLGLVALFSGVGLLFEQPAWNHISAANWGWTLYLTLFATLYCFFIQMVMFRRTTASRIALLTSTEPIFAALFALLVLGELLTWLNLLGGTLILLGMFWGRRVG